jgi:hypothetical protein
MQRPPEKLKREEVTGGLIYEMDCTFLVTNNKNMELLFTAGA